MEINIVSISDLHNGIPSVDPCVLSSNFRDIVFPHLTDETDILFIVGDFFDTLLDMSSIAGYEAACLISDIITLAIKHKFIIRVLQGTFSHDRRQNQFFEVNKDIFNKHKDGLVKVYSKVDIEHIKSMNIDILYVPADHPHKNIVQAINTKLEDYNLEKVDFILSHGYYKHLLPIGMSHIPNNVMDIDVIGKLAKASVLNGHIHTKNVYKNLINNGSFDRLSHNEEEPKGFFKLKYDTKKCLVSYEFIENVKANIFITIDLSKFKDNIESALAFFKKKLTNILYNKIDNGSRINIRVISDNDIIRNTCVKYIHDNHENIKITTKKNKKNTKEESDLQIYSIETLPKITERNIVDLIYDFLKEKNIKLDKHNIERKLC